MTPIKIHAIRCPIRWILLLKFELNGYAFQVPLEQNLQIGCYEGDIDTLELFKFIRENMDLRTINQFKQLEKIEE